jgi:hypothetical protein
MVSVAAGYHWNLMPKTPQELREQAEKQAAENPPAEGHERTPEGIEIPTPSRDGFFGNLEKVSKPGHT